MPWKSSAQRGWGHTPEGIKALGGKKKVEEWDNASKGMSLPEQVQKTPRHTTSHYAHSKIKR